MSAVTNRFEYGDKKRGLSPITVTAILFIACMLCFFWGLGGIKSAGKEQRLQTVENAIDHAVVSCYAVEGRYPESLAYLKAHYGVQYDEARYFVDYQPVAANIAPSVTVLDREDAS